MNQEDNLDFLFNQHVNSDKNKVTQRQKAAMEPKFDFVSGSQFHTGFYDQPVVNTVYIRYYQIAQFNTFPPAVSQDGISIVPKNGKRQIRSYLLKGKSSKGACFFDYEVLSIKDHKISEKKLSNFIDYLNELPKNPNHKIKYRFHPVYNFDYVDAPSGNEINECVSELLDNN